MRHWIFINLLILILSPYCLAEPIFRFGLFSAPLDIRLEKIRGSSGSYVFTNVYWSLYRYTSEGLLPGLADSCSFKNQFKNIHCKLKQNIFFEDGSPILSSHFVASINRAKQKDSDPDLQLILSNLKEARVLGKKSLEFSLKQSDPEFLYNLIHPSLAPYKAGSKAWPLASGPYKITSWESGKSFELSANPYFDRQWKHRPKVKAFVIEDDNTALNLFTAGKLDLLRRLPTPLIPEFKKHPGFFQTPVARNDIIGFSKRLNSEFNLRKQIALSPNYEELQKLYASLGTPGCLGLPEELLKEEVCLKGTKHALTSKPEKLSLGFSKMGGESVALGMEWFQNQIKKHLKINIELESQEQKMYLQMLKTSPPALFRKGMSLERPTCRAGLEIFTSGHHDNFIHFNDNKYDGMIAKMTSLEPTSSGYKVLCKKAARYLLDQFRFIPLGRIHFTSVHNEAFKGFHLNILNQLDLKDLRAVSKRDK